MQNPFHQISKMFRQNNFKKRRRSRGSSRYIYIYMYPGYREKWQPCYGQNQMLWLCIKRKRSLPLQPTIFYASMSNVSSIFLLLYPFFLLRCHRHMEIPRLRILVFLCTFCSSFVITHNESKSLLNMSK